jgi:hypothetical protein
MQSDSALFLHTLGYIYAPLLGVQVKKLLAAGQNLVPEFHKQKWIQFIDISPLS